MGSIRQLPNSPLWWINHLRKEIYLKIAQCDYRKPHGWVFVQYLVPGTCPWSRNPSVDDLPLFPTQRLISFESRPCMHVVWSCISTWFRCPGSSRPTVYLPPGIWPRFCSDHDKTWWEDGDGLMRKGIVEQDPLIYLFTDTSTDISTDISTDTYIKYLTTPRCSSFWHSDSLWSSIPSQGSSLIFWDCNQFTRRLSRSQFSRCDMHSPLLGRWLA